MKILLFYLAIYGDQQKFLWVTLEGESLKSHGPESSVYLVDWDGRDTLGSKRTLLIYVIYGLTFGRCFEKPVKE